MVGISKWFRRGSHGSRDNATCFLALSMRFCAILDFTASHQCRNPPELGVPGSGVVIPASPVDRNRLSNRYNILRADLQVRGETGGWSTIPFPVRAVPLPHFGKSISSSIGPLVFRWQLSAGSTLLAWLPFMHGGGVCWIAPPLFLLLLRSRGRAFPGARFLFRFPDPGRSPAPRAGRGRRGCLRRLALLN